jgi:hypothetical protein
VQVQVPPEQEDPPEHAVPQVPQFALSVIVFAQAPPAHWVVPVAQLDEQALLLQTAVAPLHIVVQLPQWVLSEETQLPLQLSRPVLQAHVPD